MDILHNRAVAVLLALLIVAASSVVGGGVTLGQMRANAQTTLFVYTGGAPGIHGDLREISVQAFNMTQIAGRYLQPDYVGITHLLHLRDALERAQTPREQHRAVQELLSAANALRNTLDALDLSAQDQNLLAGVVVEINLRVNLIAQNPYNSAAHGFNQALGRFPANIFGQMTGIRPLELFE